MSRQLVPVKNWPNIDRMLLMNNDNNAVRGVEMRHICLFLLFTGSRIRHCYSFESHKQYFGMMNAIIEIIMYIFYKIF